MLNKSAFPVAIRQSLDAAAFDEKLKSIPQTSKVFKKRNPTFLKANSTVEKAQGFDIERMVSMMGFKPKANDRSHSVEDLEAQENGGKIINRSFIALKAARGGSWNKNIKTENRMTEVNRNIINSNNPNVHGKNGKENFLLSALTVGVGGFIIGNRVNSRGNKIVYKIVGIGKISGSTQILALPMFAVKKARVINPAAQYHGFVKKAAEMSAAKIEGFFKMYAEKKLAASK